MAIRGRNGRGEFVRTLIQVDIDREAATLYQRFSSYREVAEAMNCDLQTAYERVQRALHSEPLDDSETAKRVALARLNAQAVIAQRIAEQAFLAHSNGRVVGLNETNAETGEQIPNSWHPLTDVGPNLAALDRLRQIEDQRNRILGIYAPTAARVEVVPTDVIEALIAQNEALIRAAERELGIAPVIDVEEIKDDSP